jgi:hypothetical protein
MAGTGGRTSTGWPRRFQHDLIGLRGRRPGGPTPSGDPQAHVFAALHAAARELTNLADQLEASPPPAPTNGEQGE